MRCYPAILHPMSSSDYRSSMDAPKKSDIKFILNPREFSAKTSACGRLCASGSTSAKPFQCSSCDLGFKERGNLNKHIGSVHDKKRTKLCHLCGKTFAFRDGLTRHISNVHKNERKHACGLCHRQFKQRSHLKKHMNTIHKNGYN